MEKIPAHFKRLQERYGDIIQTLETLKEQTHGVGPLDAKAAHLVQLAASAAVRSEGGVHSHARQAIKAGASAEEVRHALVLLIPTIGFPTVAAALAWVEEVIKD